MKSASTFLLMAALVAEVASADDYHEQMNRLKALDSRCEQARLKKLTPIRQRLIEECVIEKRGRYALQDCQAAYAAYGETTVGPNRYLIRGKFYDLPECLEATRAWIEWEASQPRRVE